MTTDPAAGKPNIEVSDDPQHTRYQVLVDGEPAGGAYYEINDGRVVFTHTEVDSKWGGRGVGSALARAALDDVRATGRQAIPICPFITSFIKRHPEYVEVVAPEYRSRVA